MLKSITLPSDLIIRDLTTCLSSESDKSPLLATMSLQSAQLNSGRYSKPVPRSNFEADGDDLEEFLPFPGHLKPKGLQPSDGDLMVVSIDMLLSTNRPNHFTSEYDTEFLVIRRGSEFLITVMFNRPVTSDDKFQLEFLIGKNPSSTKGSLVTVSFEQGSSSGWAGQIVEMQDTSVTLGITPLPTAIVGKYRLYVTVVTPSGMQRCRKEDSTILYVLFNAWCPDDAVFLPNEAERLEYVKNDIGVIYQGSFDSVTQRNWMYGQFEHGILDACIFILDVSKMPIWDRSDVIKVIRKGSAMLNAQDDAGVLVGNWSNDYSMGTPPTAWTGSVKILRQYAKTEVPVCYAQCWVFAGVFNTFLRCLGIPARVVSNFNSAHDNTGNLKTDLIFTADGTPDRDETRDSIWNYHCWNEVFIDRHDLPKGFGGWQVVDSTPQETSDGYFRCGPASVVAIKDGLICHPFDAGFVFAEVNSDVVFYQRDKYGQMTPYNVDTTYVGKLICTKAVNSSGSQDITGNYKYSEGSPKDKETMERAEEYGCQRDHSHVPDCPITVVIHTTEAYVGDDIELDIEFQNPSDLEKVVHALLSGSVIYYTGVVANSLKEMTLDITIPGNNVEHIKVKITADEYMHILGSQLSLQFIVTGLTESQSASCMKVVNLKTKELNMMIRGLAQVNHELSVTVNFTNLFPFPLNNVYLCMEGSGVMEYKSHFYRSIDAGTTVSWKEKFQPRLHGLRGIVAVMYSSSFCMYGYVVLNIKP